MVGASLMMGEDVISRDVSRIKYVNKRTTSITVEADAVLISFTIRWIPTSWRRVLRVASTMNQSEKTHLHDNIHTELQW